MLEDEYLMYIFIAVSTAQHDFWPVFPHKLGLDHFFHLGLSRAKPNFAGF